MGLKGSTTGEDLFGVIPKRWLTVELSTNGLKMTAAGNSAPGCKVRHCDKAANKAISGPRKALSFRHYINHFKQGGNQ